MSLRNILGCSAYDDILVEEDRWRRNDIETPLSWSQAQDTKLRRICFAVFKKIRSELENA